MTKKTLEILKMAKNAQLSNLYYDLIARLAKGDLFEKTYEFPSGAHATREGLVAEIEKLESLLQKPKRPKPKTVPPRIV